ncbi:MAG: Type III pantothenate kinase [Catillopecten margaritatus gill symbiont]|uniref:Type III pantothenate kinase n=1 Tax=Catillopecten margaritatus gill symbiont TaxID=3083288 RepID=A0AAU6PI46_9GAMM
MASNLFVDIGSSTVSWEIDGNYQSIHIEDFQSDAIPPHQASTIACVANHQLIEHFSNPTIVQPKPLAGIVFGYNLEQLGIDRFLGLVAGFEKYPEHSFMVIDVGTFVTIDSVQNGKHIDGGIAPGLYQLQAGKKFTGNDSQKSWKMGTENMLRDYIDRRTANFKGKILVTGGGQEITHIEQGEYHQNLVIEGLRIINEQ